jgi:hypothetical protein
MFAVFYPKEARFKELDPHRLKIGAIGFPEFDKRMLMRATDCIGERYLGGSYLSKLAQPVTDLFGAIYPRGNYLSKL